MKTPAGAYQAYLFTLATVDEEAGVKTLLVNSVLQRGRKRPNCDWDIVVVKQYPSWRAWEKVESSGLRQAAYVHREAAVANDHVVVAVPLVVRATRQSRPDDPTDTMVYIMNHLELREQARRLGVAERVDWHGQVEDPFPYYDAASIFVLPSMHEGSPNALIEAMSRGLAAIVSDASPGPLELVTDEVSGLVFPVTDAEALAAAIERLARAPELRERLGTEAQEQVSQHDLSSVLDCLEDLLEPRDAV